MQQTIVRACDHILSWNIVYNVSLVCWEVYEIWENLTYIYKSSDWEASCPHSEKKEWVERWAHQNLVDLQELSEIAYRYLKQGWTIEDMRRDIDRAFNLTNCEIEINEGQHQHYSRQIEGYLTGHIHCCTHWIQAYIQNRSDQCRGRQVRTQEIYNSVTNDEW